MPAEEEHKNGLQQALVKEIEAAGYLVLWQRDVPFQYENCGPGAQKVMPSFVQLFIKRPLEVQTDRDFEDRLYRLRRKLEKTYHAGEMAICSLSSKTIVYKGMLHAYQVGIFMMICRMKTLQRVSQLYILAFLPTHFQVGTALSHSVS